MDNVSVFELPNNACILISGCVGISSEVGEIGVTAGSGLRLFES